MRIQNATAPRGKSRRGRRNDAHRNENRPPLSSTATADDQSPAKRLHELLGQLGNNQITVATFWALMAKSGLSNVDIDTYCAEHGGWISSHDYVQRYLESL
jgi:hypothetical protein